jgi:CRP/FNR family transcriptional regulator, cyclic AMP receptor protein
VARFRQDAKVALLQRSPLFQGLSKKQLLQVARLTDDLEVPAGTVLCEEGTIGREFFVIIEGQASVVKRGEPVATLGAGEFFGEIALLEHVKRTATVTASTPLRFFVVSSRAFTSLLDTDPAVERKVLHGLARHLLGLTGDPTVG